MRAYSIKKSGTDPKKTNNRKSHSRGRRGKISIVGIGPGANDHITPRAIKQIRGSDIIIGYTTYIKLLSGLAGKKPVLSFPMTEEVKRAKFAIETAKKGKRVCVVSSGDPGVYGLAGVILQLLPENNKTEIEIAPGITAANSCSALLGAPLMNDFAIISLSDLMTDVKIIEKRIKSASEGDFVIVFYNPKSRTRTLPIEMAWKILMKRRKPATPVGVVKNAYREEQKIKIVKLKDLLKEDIDMLTTIIVGNSKTRVIGNYMVTPRGYKI